MSWLLALKVQQQESQNFLYIYNSHANKYKVTSHCGFDLHFPNTSDIEYLSTTYKTFVYL